MKGFFRRMGRWALPSGLAVIAAGCFFTNEDKSGNNVPPIIPVGPMACADLNPTQQRQGDSIVDIAADMQGRELLYLFDTSGGEWDSMKTVDPQPVLNLYNQALQVAPGHCGALFGRAVANAMMVVKDQRLDAFIAKLDVEPQVRGVGDLFRKVGPEGAQPVLLKTSESMRAMDRTTIRELQDLLELSILPRLDTVLGDLEQVLRYQKFLFTYRFITVDPFSGPDTNTVIFDQVVLGPAMAGLKVGKSVLLMVAGYDWEIAQGGSYAWIDTLQTIEDADFDNLSPGRISALDHAKSLFQTSSPFTRLRPSLAGAVPQIPTLLASAADNVQLSLRYGLQLAAAPPADRAYRLLSIGTSVEDDLDPADANDMIALMDSVKGYLGGERIIRYNRDRNSIRVDFARIFQWNGLQQFLPYFQFYDPYSKWNDTVGADTTWYGGFYLTNSAQMEAFRLLGLGNRQSGVNWGMYIYDSLGILVVQYYSYFPTYSELRIATLTPDGVNPCRFSYAKGYDMVGSPTDNGIQWTPNQTQGTIQLSLCRDGGGFAEYAELDVRITGPLYFTDAAGTRTFGLDGFDTINDPRDLAGKVVFPDPTFGGVFPGLTNSNIWQTIASLDSVEIRTREVCTWDSLTWIQNCVWEKPTNPSTVDLFVWIAAQMFNSGNGGMGGPPLSAIAALSKSK